MNVDDSVDTPDYALYWAKELGAKPNTIVRMRGGINNRVFRCGERPYWIIKGYPKDDKGSTNRMGNELEFLNFSKYVADGYTPRVIHADNSRCCLITEYINGRSFGGSVHVSEEDMEHAVKFFRRLNQHAELADQLINHDATEGYLKISDHVANIKTGYQRWNTIMYQKVEACCRTTCQLD